MNCVVSVCVSPCSRPRTYKVRTMKAGLKITRSVRTLTNVFPPSRLLRTISIHLLEKTSAETFTREDCLQGSVEVMDGWTFLG